jgi:alkyl hydroperoxide reductase subunit D
LRYYRFRHFMKDAGRTTYGDKPARLRMQRIAKPAGDKALFELMCLAVSAIGGCELCVQSHELVVLQAGLTDDQVHDAVRVAATVNGVATARAIQA